MVGINLRMTAALPEIIVLLLLVYLLCSNEMHDILNTYIYQIPHMVCVTPSWGEQLVTWSKTVYLYDVT